MSEPPSIQLSLHLLDRLRELVGPEALAAIRQQIDSERRAATAQEGAAS